MGSPAGRRFKDAVYVHFARIGHAVSTPKRIELLDLLGHAERTVADLAEQTATPVKNTSAHLRVLRQAGLVETRKQGPHVVYRLVDLRVHDFVRQLQGLARVRFAEVEQITKMYVDGNDELEPVSVRELERRIRRGDVVVIDVRPREEYEAGHIPGALSVPVEHLKRDGRNRAALPKSREIVAYCRGRYCVCAVEAITLLRKRGFNARRLADGFPGWRQEGGRVVTSS